MKQEAFFRRIFKTRSTSVVGDSRGQAVIEYILLLVIIVSLVVGMRGVFGSMNNFMSDIVGGYVSCLMEYGELPALGVEEADLKQHRDGDGKRCPLPSFSAVAASGAASGSGGSGASSGSGGANGSGGRNGKGSNGSADNKGNGSNTADRESSEVSSGSGSGSARSARARSRNSSPYSQGQIARAGDGGSTADNPQDLNDSAKLKVIEEPGQAGDGGNRRSSRRATAVRPKYKSVSGRMAAELDKSARISRKPGSTLLALDEGYRLAALKRTINPPEYKEKIEEQKDEGFNFGNFLKWIIIAGILIACFILFGGQVMNYSNSDS